MLFLPQSAFICFVDFLVLFAGKFSVLCLLYHFTDSHISQASMKIQPHGCLTTLKYHLMDNVTGLVVILVTIVFIQVILPLFGSGVS